MALQIKERKGTFYLKGNINFKTVSFLKPYFNEIESNTVVLNIDKLKEFDTECFNAIFVLLRNDNKTFSVVSASHKSIYKQFSLKEIA